MGNRHKPIKTQKQEQKLKVKEKIKLYFLSSAL